MLWVIGIAGAVVVTWWLLVVPDGPDRPLSRGRYQHTVECAAPWQPLPCRTCGGGRDVA